MKFSLVSMAFALVMTLIITSCNPEADKSSTVNTNFSVTASGQYAVAQSGFQKSFSYLFSSAIALTPPPLEDSNGAGISLNEAWIVLKKVHFNSTQHYEGPFFIDLLSDEPIYFGEITLPNEGITRVKMLLHKENNVPDTVPGVMNGKSIYLNGMINNHNFIYIADDTTDFDIEGEEAVVPEEGKDLVAVIRLADLLKKIDLSTITADTTISSSSRVSATNPCPAIHATASDLYTCFRKGIAMEAKLGKDNGSRDISVD